MKKMVAVGAFTVLLWVWLQYKYKTVGRGRRAPATSQRSMVSDA